MAAVFSAGCASGRGIACCMVAKLSTECLKNVGSSVILSVYFCFHSSEFNLGCDTMFAAISVLR